MSPYRKIILVLGSTTGAVLALDAALPLLLTRFTNRKLAHLGAYRGKVSRVSLHPMVPSIVVEGLSLASIHGNGALGALEVGSIVLGSNWHELLAGRLAAHVLIDSPRARLHLPGNGKRNDADPASHSDGNARLLDNIRVWRGRLELLPSFRISSFVDSVFTSNA